MIILYVLASVLFMTLLARMLYMPGFFKRLPRKEEFWKKGQYEIYTHKVAPLRYCSTEYHGLENTYGIAYIKVRLQALKRDLLSTNYLGVAWEIKDLNETPN